MSISDPHEVTDDPELLAALRAKDEAGAGSRELGIYAFEELGLVPPSRLSNGSIPDIVFRWPAGVDDDFPGLIVWSLNFDDDEPADDYDETGSSWPDWSYQRPEEDTPPSP